MRIKVNMDKGALKKLERAQIVALEQTAEAIKTDVIAKNVMPFDMGTMQNESTSIDTRQSRLGIVSITSDMPYARKLYFHPEYNFKKDKNPHAQGRWYDAWIDGARKDFALRAFKKLYRRITGV